MRTNPLKKTYTCNEEVGCPEKEDTDEAITRKSVTNDWREKHFRKQLQARWTSLQSTVEARHPRQRRHQQLQTRRCQKSAPSTLACLCSAAGCSGTSSRASWPGTRSSCTRSRKGRDKRVGRLDEDGVLLHLAIAVNDLAMFKLMCKLERLNPVCKDDGKLRLRQMRRCAVLYSRVSVLAYLDEQKESDLLF